MVDLLSSCQDIYNNFGWNRKHQSEDKKIIRAVPMKPEPIGTVQFGQRYPANNLRMRKRSRNDLFNGVQTANNPNKGSQLAQFKIMPTILPDVVSTQRAIMWNSCTKCSPMFRKTLTSDVQPLGLRNILLVDSMNPDKGYLTRKFHHAAHILKTNASFTYPSDSEAILSSDRVNNAIDNAALQDMQEGEPGLLKYNDLLAKHRLRAAQVLKTMQARVSCLLIRLTAWVLFKVFGKLLTSVQVQQAQLDVIRKACATGKPVIYLPLHRSHLDYLLLTFILYNYEIKAPLVAAGDNLRIPVFGPILRGLGAFFIKRKLDPKKGKRDYVYRAILHTYMEQSLREGHSIEFFVEGGRSRSGKACLPKGGLLSVVVDAFMDGVIDDAYIVPVGISYEKLLDSGFIQEQMGRPKVMENFVSTIRAIRGALSMNYGAVRVDFSQPFSLKEFIQAAQSYVECKPWNPSLDAPTSPNGSIRRLPSSSSLYGTDIVVEDARVLIKGLAEHVLHDAVHSTALMSTNVLAFLLLNKYRQGVLMRSLVQDFNWVWDEILDRGRNVGFSGDPKAVVQNALQLLEERLVSVTEPDQYESGSERCIDLTFVQPNLALPDVLELSYYSNVAMSAFLGDAIVATSLIVLVGENTMDSFQDMQSEITVNRQALMDKSLELCSILQYEFLITSPCVTLETSLGEIMHGFTLSEILVTEERPGGNGKRAWADRFAHNLEWTVNSDEDEDEFFYDQTNYRVCLTKESIARLKFYRNILTPFLEGYWQLVRSLVHLVKTEMEETRFIRIVQKASQEKMKKGEITCSECIAAETLRNGLKLLESWKVIDSHNQDNVKVIFLTDHFDSEEKIDEVLTTLEDFRK